MTCAHITPISQELLIKAASSLQPDVVAVVSVRDKSRNLSNMADLRLSACFLCIISAKRVPLLGKIEFSSSCTLQKKISIKGFVVFFQWFHQCPHDSFGPERDQGAGFAGATEGEWREFAPEMQWRWMEECRLALWGCFFTWSWLGAVEKMAHQFWNNYNIYLGGENGGKKEMGVWSNGEGNVFSVEVEKNSWMGRLLSIL